MTPDSFIVPAALSAIREVYLWQRNLLRARKQRRDDARSEAARHIESPRDGGTLRPWRAEQPIYHRLPGPTVGDGE